MFLRKKINKSGATSVQIIDKSTGRYRVLESVGSSEDERKIAGMMSEGIKRMQILSGRPEFNFEVGREAELVELFFAGTKEILLVGPELVLGKLFEEIGFGAIPDDIFRHLVLARLCYPASKGSAWRPETAIDIANTIFSISISLPFSKNIEKRILSLNQEQKSLLEMFET